MIIRTFMDFLLWIDNPRCPPQQNKDISTGPCGKTLFKIYFTETTAPFKKETCL